MNEPVLCRFCPHAAHPAGVFCPLCNCEGKPGFWRGFWSALGNAIGNAKFGGN
jgi:hypothetical protein